MVDGNATYTATVTGLDPSSSYAFAMTTVDTQKGESGLSDLATLTPSSGDSGGEVPPQPPAVRTTPAITWPTPSPIVQGTALSATQLNATASVLGTFAYSPAAGTVLPSGTQTLSATFTPTNATLYTTATAWMSLVVSAPPAPRRTPIITWATPAPIVQGTALSGTQLNATASVPGTFVYAPSAGTVLPAGTQTLAATFAPADTTAYNGTTAATSLTVNAVIYKLTVVRPTGGMISGAGISCGTTGTLCEVTMTAATALGLQATPDTDFSFSGWTGDCMGTSRTVIFELNGPRSCGATFAAAGSTSTTSPNPVPPPSDTVLPLGAPYQLTIIRPGGGVVKGAGINCGTKSKFCAVNMPGPITIGLQATPESGYTFAGWTGHCSGTSPSFALALEGSRMCGATFAAVGSVPSPNPVSEPAPTPAPADIGLPMGAPYKLTIDRPAGGTITSAGTSCGTTGKDCSVNMPAAMWIGLQATPDAGYTFAGWTGNCSGTSLGYALALNGARTCGGIFTKTANGSRP